MATIIMQREKVLKETFTLEIDESMDPEMVIAAINITNDSRMKKFEAKYGFGFSPEPEMTRTLKKTKGTYTVKLKGNKDPKVLEKELKEKAEKCSGYIEFSISGIGSDEEYTNTEISGTTRFPIDSADWDCLDDWDEIDGFDVENINDRACVYLYEFFDAPYDIKELQYEDYEEECYMLSWAKELSGIEYIKTSSRTRSPAAYLEWTITVKK